MAANPPRRRGFERAARLRTGRDFTQPKLRGSRLALGCLIANWLRQEPAARSRLGVVTSRRLGGAVVRSRARRLLRECFRLHQHELAQAVDLVLIARASIVGKGLAEVERDFLTTLRKAGLLRERGEA